MWSVPALSVQAVELMSVPRFQPVVLGLLYHISMEDKYKSLFTFTDCLNRMYDMLMRVQVRSKDWVGTWGSWRGANGWVKSAIKELAAASGTYRQGAGSKGQSRCLCICETYLWPGHEVFLYCCVKRIWVPRVLTRIHASICLQPRA